MAEVVKIEGFDELKRAFARNPQTIIRESKKFMQRGMSKYKKGIISNPWGVNDAGGGAPVKTGNLRDTHETNIQNFYAAIFPTAKYAKYVHGIDGFPRKGVYKLRPWLDYVKEKNEHRIESLYRELLKNISVDLSK